MSGRIVKVSGPLVVAKGLRNANIADTVRIGKQCLAGEILTINDDCASILVYEDTSGLSPETEVTLTGTPLTVELGPGLLENIYDGIQRPLLDMHKKSGFAVEPGSSIPALSRKRRWEFIPTAASGDEVTGGSIIGTVAETDSVSHRIMIPHGITGVVELISQGDFTVEDSVCAVKTADGRLIDITMMQNWPVRVNRPYAKKLLPSAPLCTGQRVVDTLFPIAKGGTAALPGPFGSGKTVMQHQLARWAEADVIIFIGCGERGNEMSGLLKELSELCDPRTGIPLIKRIVLIANTSDMPLAAREASIFTGITIAEYFRDMGLDAVVAADSVSRWAEGMRDVSRCLEEQSCEDGYPAYLQSRLARFFERAGCVECTGGNRRGSVTVIGTISPPCGDAEEPVSQALRHITKVNLDFDAALACSGHFPAVNWLNSYSLYLDSLKTWYNETFGPDFLQNRSRAMALLQKEARLLELEKLIGHDMLSPFDNLALETAKMIREDFLQQNAFISPDCFSSYEKQAMLLSLILYYNDLCVDALERDLAALYSLFTIPAREMISRAKMIGLDEFEEKYRSIANDMERQIEKIIKGGDTA